MQFLQDFSFFFRDLIKGMNKERHSGDNVTHSGRPVSPDMFASEEEVEEKESFVEVDELVSAMDEEEYPSTPPKISNKKGRKRKKTMGKPTPEVIFRQHCRVNVCRYIG